jgi:hypothetical protein
MAFKKPKWLSKAQKAVKIENKPAILQKVQNVAQSAVNSAGNFFKSVAEPYQDRAPKVKAMPENPTGLAGTKTSPQAFDPVDAQVAMGKAMTSANRASNSAFVQKGMAEDRQDVQSKLNSSGYTPIVQRISDKLAEGVQVASGGSAIMALPNIDANAEDNQVTPRPAQATVPKPRPVVDMVAPDVNYDRFQQQPAQNVSRLTEEQAPQRMGGSKLARALRRLPKRRMSM